MAAHPAGPGDRHDRQRPAGDRRGETGGVGDTCRSATRASCSSSMRTVRVDVRLRHAVGGDRVGELAGRVPRDRALLLDHPGQVAEERHALERVVGPEWIILRHGGMVCGWRPDPTATGDRSADDEQSSSPVRRARSAAGCAPGWPPTRRSTGSSRSTASRCPAGRPADRPAGRRPEGPRSTGADAVIHLASAFGPAVDDDPEIVAGRRRGDGPPGARRRRPPPGPPTSWCCRRPRSTAPGPTTRCRSPRTRRCGPTRTCAFAVQKAEIERLAVEWRDQHPGHHGHRAPPGPAVGRRRSPAGWRRALRAAGEVRSPDDDPPVQFLHLDDLVAAVDLAAPRPARRRRSTSPPTAG